ncbi:lysylphosphatidylglycerol synthase domain-containing protein [Sphingomonas sp.]|uniref:lysylphosphatidylglycerol synthase domain-containing protein n=1 Tax=Sphingomonas sp. TaxID=28214 RepID=UPI002B64716F|nr:lysylphosphatidylglycerol synthase domain-containing protein [Sphingomonas sp.]HWK35228.1 lysylphosphatidylglycerol synthase domain-containing protein [Sphingomonas sp.]
MKRSAILAVAVGLVLAITLIATNDVAAIAAALRQAGWGIVLVVLLHLPQTLASAMGWQALLERRAPLPFAYGLRWVRESVNALLPVAQLGGDLVRARLLARRGTPLPAAVAANMVDLSVETGTQALFTILCVALLVAGPHGGEALPLAIGLAAAGASVAIAFAVAQRFGLFALIERGVARWTRGRDLAGLHDAVVALYGRPGPLARSSSLHLASWLLGGLEIYAALHALGIDASLREAIVIEGLAQAVRSVGFLVPGALGVQEGGYLLIGAMFGIAAPQALALALIRRIRELALGLPGLALWHRLEARPAAPATGGAT